jgi:hypothetical protein
LGASSDISQIPESNASDIKFRIFLALTQFNLAVPTIELIISTWGRREKLGLLAGLQAGWISEIMVRDLVG